MKQEIDGSDRPTRRKRNFPPKLERTVPSYIKDEDLEIPILLHRPKGNFTARMMAVRLRGRIEEILKREGEPFDSPLVYSPVKQAIRGMLTEMEEAIDWYKRELSQFLYDTGTEFSNRAWIRNDGKIMANLNRRRNRGLLPMMEYLAEKQIPFLQSRSYGKIEIEGKMEFPILVVPDIPGIAKRIGRSESQATKYIAGAERAGLLRRLGTKHRGSFLVLGHHDFYKKDGNWQRRPVYFLKDTPAIREALRTFRRPD